MKAKLAMLACTAVLMGIAAVGLAQNTNTNTNTNTNANNTNRGNRNANNSNGNTWNTNVNNTSPAPITQARRHSARIPASMGGSLNLRDTTLAMLIADVR